MEGALRGIRLGYIHSQDGRAAVACTATRSLGVVLEVRTELASHLEHARTELASAQRAISIVARGTFSAAQPMVTDAIQVFRVGDGCLCDSMHLTPIGIRRPSHKARLPPPRHLSVGSLRAQSRYRSCRSKGPTLCGSAPASKRVIFLTNARQLSSADASGSRAMRASEGSDPRRWRL